MSDGFRGEFLWHELESTDPAGAQDFYAKIVGWTPTPYGEPMEGGERYVIFNWGESGMAGLMRLPEQAKAMGAPPHWLCYIGCPNVDDTVRQATQLGARTFVPPTDIPSIGRFAVLGDPQGAVFAAFTPLPMPTPPERPDKPGLGDWAWHELVTTDYEKAYWFYNAIFGWEKTDAADIPSIGTYQMYGWKGRTLGGMFNKPASMPAPPHWMPYVRVPDVKKAAEKIAPSGGKVINGPMDVPGGDMIVQGIDPQGAVFSLVSAKV